MESPDALYQPGAKVEGARVVEIDRKRKRITVSLQSEARVGDENASMKARKERQDKRQRTFGSSKKKSGEDPDTIRRREEHNPKLPMRNEAKPAVNPEEHFPANTPEHCGSRSSEPKAKPQPEMTPAEVKRARKLARRAARREQREQEGATVKQ